jgi:hypothetical protein
MKRKKEGKKEDRKNIKISKCRNTEINTQIKVSSNREHNIT